jgi:hypothetical protein
MHRGYIKLWRKITEWEWYKSSETFHLFMHLLINANYKPSRFMGHDILRGEIVVGRKSLSEDTGISERSIRTSIDHLKNTGEVTSKSTNKFTILTLCNYEAYQDTNIHIDQQNANNRPATDQQPTTSKEIKKEKNEKNIIPPSLEMVSKYCLERKNTIISSIFIDHYSSNGWMIGKSKMKDWQAAIRTWEGRETKRPIEPERILKPYKPLPPPPFPNYNQDSK